MSGDRSVLRAEPLRPPLPPDVVDSTALLPKTLHAPRRLAEALVRSRQGDPACPRLPRRSEPVGRAASLASTVATPSSPSPHASGSVPREMSLRRRELQPARPKHRQIFSAALVELAVASTMSCGPFKAAVAAAVTVVNAP